MRTVKEISDLTGISVRTLHYYDEIGLLKPTEKNEAGYRLYDDKALETLQQILFFREFDIPLKEIKVVMENPALEKNKLLQVQRTMLAAKKERLERLIANIDDILKGDNKMDFEVFSKSEIEELCLTSIANMPDVMRESIIKDFGSLEQWRKHYIERCSQKDIQKGYQKMIEWYGSKEEALKFAKHPPSMDVVQAYQNRLDFVMKKLVERKEKGYLPNSFEIKEVIGEYGFIIKQLYQVKDEKELMLGILSWYKDKKVIDANDKQYGKGITEFFVQAVKKFYQTD